jgi:alpha,alpha-trehalose-phosphate synthase [UDP-forming]
LIAGVTVISVASTYFDVLAHRHVLRQELDRQTRWMAVSIVPGVQSAVASGNLAVLPRLTQQLRNSTGALGLAVYDAHGNMLASAGPDPVMGSLTRSPIAHSLQRQIEISDFSRNGHWEWLEHTVPLRDASNHVAGAMAVVADAGYIRDDANAYWRRMFWRIAALVLLIVAITAGMVSWFLLRPISRITERLHRLRTGKGLESLSEPVSGDLALFSPITREVETIAESLKAARAAAATEARLRESGEPWWTAEKLALHIRSNSGGSKIFVVSNREPYMHVRRGRELECVVPPSGLVTALEPILRACDGVWVASGSGDGDTMTVDEFDHLRVPPDDPKYTLRRVWLTEEEEAQYYDGFANEGLWPLCHIAHTRPIFRPGDWECYQAINERFARALLAEMKNSPDPIVFVQDYHFALLPQMVKRARPDARVAIFWHIPWPNPEAFGICPWQNEILDGLLGADLIGFHIPLHCHNFLSTVDRALESRTSHEHLTTSRRGHLTTVRAYPVSVACEGPMRSADGAGLETPEAQREHQQAALRARLLEPFGVRAEYLAVGVDRLDYTKGIVERLMALEQLLQERPWYRDRLTMLQIAAPSRTRISTYVDLRARVEETAERINARYQTARWKPVILVERQCNHHEVAQWYRAADLCLVTSLHDGMNLVAKEFVAERSDDDGVLVLSRFAGAAGELVDALLVNPYDVAGVAEAMHRGLQMSLPERRERMRRMRRHVMEHNIYLWAANILGDLRELRIEDEEQKPIQAVSGPLQQITTDEELQRRTA